MSQGQDPLTFTNISLRSELRLIANASKTIERLTLQCADTTTSRVSRREITQRDGRDFRRR